MSDTKTTDTMIGELTRANANMKALIDAHNEPLKERIKENDKRIARLLLDDGKQQVNMTLLGEDK